MEQRSLPVLIVPMASLILAVAAAAMAALFMSTRTAHAEISGPCIATIAGVDVGGVNSGNRSDDIHVSQDDQVTVGAASAVGFQSHKIQLEFASRRWTVSEEDDDGATSWSGTVNVDDYATYGVGLYKVIGVSTLVDGTTCEGAATVDVDGNPLTTVAGAAAAGLVGAGTVAAVGSGARNALSPFGPIGEVVGEAWDEQRARREEEEGERSRELWESERLDRAMGNLNTWWSIVGCLLAAGAALLMTPLMALTGGGGGSEGGGPAEPTPPARSSKEPVRLPRAPWRPRISILGLASGFLAGAGIVVLLQQYSIQYPTLGAIITWVLIGIAVYGIALPTLGYTLGWLRINGRIARLEREISGA